MAEPDLPEDVANEAERLTRLARGAVDESEADAYLDRRTTILDAHDYEALIREEDDALVCYPEQWSEDGSIQVDRIDDTDRAVERYLSEPGDADAWDEIESHNADVVAAVEAEHGPVHAANARAFADYMGNHHVRRVEEASPNEVATFLEEYFPRNAWPSTEQQESVETSLELVFDIGEADAPGRPQ